MKVKLLNMFAVFFLSINPIEWTSDADPFFISFGIIAYAQKPKFPYEIREAGKEGLARKEGLAKKRLLVEGEKLVLLSAAIENREKKQDQFIPHEFNLGFQLQDAVQMKIEVRELRVRENGYYYKMQPLQSNFLSGPHCFPWPSEIPTFYKIELSDLYPLAKGKGSPFTQIVPIVLFYQKPENSELAYRFTFNPLQSISRLEYSFSKFSTKEHVYSGTLENLSKDKIFQIRWNGKTFDNRDMADERIWLKLKVTFRSPPGAQVQRELIWNYQFEHFNDLLNQQLFVRK